MPVSISGTNGVTFPDSSLQAAAASPYVLKNRIINGDMRIDQRNAGASVTVGATTAYTLDRWNIYSAQASKLSAQQNAGAVTPPAGFTNYLGITSLSAYSVLAADEFLLRQHIEGLNIADLAWGTASASSITISFWVRSSLTGTFGGSLLNSAQNRSYPFSYSIPVANTWTQISVTIAGETTGTWLTTNGVGMYVVLGLGVGSTYGSGTAGAWVGSTVDVPTGSTSVVGTNGATFYITGVQLELGSTATPFERRLYNQELANCQRYYIEYPASTILTGYQDGTTNIAGTLNTPVTLRATPTMTYGAGTTYALIETTYKTSNSTSLSGINFYGANQVQFKLGGFTGLNDLRIANLLPPAKITISSEL